jgi:Mrp family chromosome partitioning ATPase
MSTCSTTCSTCASESCSAKDKQPQETPEQYADRQKLAKRLCRIKHKVAVMSGKGGVGKSTVAANVAISLAKQGYKTGLLDIDVHGPSVPTLFGLQEAGLVQDETGILPLEPMPNLKLMSAGFMLQHPDQALIWRGPMKAGAIKQLLGDVAWGDLDYLIVDCPPGTGDEPLAICQMIDDMAGSLIVTTPQEMAAADVRKSITFCNKIELPILGIIENMSGFVCPHCNGEIHPFKQGGGENMARQYNLPFLGRIPLDMDMMHKADTGSLMDGTNNTEIFNAIIDPLTKLKG